MTNEGVQLAADVRALMHKAWNEGHAAGEKLGWRRAVESGAKEAVCGLALLVGFALGCVFTWLVVAS